MPGLLQTITITWTKASRGGELATLRAKIPKQHPLPAIKPQEANNHFWHNLHYSEENRFTTPTRNELKQLPLTDTFKFQSIELNLDGTAAILSYRYQDGAPARMHHDQTGTLVPETHSLRLEPGTWASLEYNHRLTDFDTGNWWYEHLIVNVVISEQINFQNPFAHPPAQHFSLLSQLK